MNVQELAALVGAQIIAPADREIGCGCSCDLLSWVMAHGKPDMAWVTVQTHMNAIAVAMLTGAACIIAAGGAQFAPDAIEKAQSEKIALLASTKSAFEICADMARAGVQ